MIAAASFPFRGFTFAMLTLALIALSSVGCTTQRSFASPDDAVQGLVTAMRADDTKKLEEIFGPSSDDLLFSGDPVDDQATRDRFLEAFDEKHQLVSNDDNS